MCFLISNLIISYFLNPRRSFYDFFDVPDSYHQLDTASIRVLRIKKWICDSLFVGMNSFGENGGCILVSDNYAYFYTVVERCSFISCEANSGGAIYISTSEGEIVLNKICGISCKSNSNGNHMFGHLYSKTNGRNEAYYVSLCDCSSKTSSNSYTWEMQRGKQTIFSSNSSKNSVYRSSGCYIQASGSCNCSFLHFSNNSAQIDIVYFYNSDNFVLNHCNMINNLLIQPGSDSCIILSFQSNVLIQNCYFSNNSIGNGKLIKKSGTGVMTINEMSIVDHIINEVGLISTHSYEEFTMFSTGQCYADVTLEAESPNPTQTYKSNSIPSMSIPYKTAPLWNYIQTLNIIRTPFPTFPILPTKLDNAQHECEVLPSLSPFPTWNQCSYQNQNTNRNHYGDMKIMTVFSLIHYS